MQQEIKSSHTPGPWRAVEKFGSIKHENGGTVAMVDDHYVPSPVHGFPIDRERHANARLIAAAPELLYALERLVKELPSRRDWLDPDTEKLARHAVDKAQGKI